MTAPNAFVLALALMAVTVAYYKEPAFAGPVDEGFFESVGGAKIYYNVRGEGEPVLLIHGYTATGSTNWGVSGVISSLADRYRVIVLDNRGHGKSDKPTDESDYGTKMVDDAIGLLDHLKIEKAHVVGYSMGGMITMKMLTTRPERMLSAAVCGMGWIREGDRDRYRDDGGEAQDGAASDADGADAEDDAPAGDDADKRGPVRERIRERVRERVLENLPDTDDPLVACRRAFGDFAVAKEEILAVKIPTIVIVGTNDSLLERTVKPLQAIDPPMEFRLIEGATHMNCCFKPEFKAVLSAWLDARAAE